MNKTLTDDWLDRWDGAMMHSFATPKRVFSKASGYTITDVDDRVYTDMFSGIAVGGLGHAHPAIIKAVSDQIATLGHISNLFASQPQIELAEQLAGLVHSYSPQTPVGIYFGNSGTEANEAAFKITRLTNRRRIVAMAGSFHGRTMGALALTSTEKYRTPFEPLPGDVVFVPYGDVQALEDAVDETTAAVVMETIQGESGVVPAPQGFIEQARRITSRHGALLWIDEVQTGMGRCGEWFTSLADGVIPDLITVAKGLGNGIPVSACIGLGSCASFFQPGSHGSTYSGNPVAAAAGLAVIRTIREQGLLERVTQLGFYLHAALREAAHPLIDEVRGRGLLVGIHLRQPISSEVERAMLDRGWIINAPRPDVIRLAPPFVIDEQICDRFVSTLVQVLDEHR